MAEIWDAALRAGAIIFVYMTVWFLLAQALRRNDIVDSAWGLGFVVVALDAACVSCAPTPRSVLVLLLVGLWGLRLATYVTVRNIGKAEDFRYATWRREWGRWFVPRTFLQVFMLQGLFMWIISAPIIVVGAAMPETLGPLDLFGALLFGVGFLFESVGDYQLYAFKSDPANKGRVMKSGVWRYTRHPNYFGEVVVWFGIWVVALSVPYGAFAVISPLTITALLLGISGIPMLERTYADDRAYQEYKQETSAFFPLPPRRGAPS